MSMWFSNLLKLTSRPLAISRLLSDDLQVLSKQSFCSIRFSASVAVTSGDFGKLGLENTVLVTGC